MTNLKLGNWEYKTTHRLLDHPFEAKHLDRMDLQHLAMAAADLEGDGWELISHAFVPYGDDLLVSFVFRRPV